MIAAGDLLMATPQLLTEEVVLSLLDAKHGGWKGHREGWVTVEHCGVAWRVHYRRGELLEVGWWAPARLDVHWARRVSHRQLGR